MINVPNIRFKGFAEDWEQRKVSEIADRYDNLRIPVAANLRVSGSTPYYGANGIQDYVDGFTHDGEFVLVAEDGANDLKNYPVRYVKGRIWVNNHAHVLQGKEKVADNLFLSYGLGRANIESLLVGGGRAKLNAEIMMGIDIQLPSYLEQTKIGAYFKQIDNLITLQQRKYNKLINIKKSMLEKMFPKNGEKTPEIRFKGFTDDWEQRKLEDFVNYTSSNLSAKDAEEFGKYDLYDANKMIGKTTKTAMLDEYITVIKDGAGVGRIRRLPKNTMFIGTMGGLTTEVADLDFVYSLLTAFDLSEETVGTTIPHIYFKNYGKNEYLIPSVEEQAKIGEYFSHLDNAITLHQCELEKLQNIKKALLEKMFV